MCVSDDGWHNSFTYKVEPRELGLQLAVQTVHGHTKDVKISIFLNLNPWIELWTMVPTAFCQPHRHTQLGNLHYWHQSLSLSFYLQWWEELQLYHYEQWYSGTATTIMYGGRTPRYYQAASLLFYFWHMVSSSK